MGYWYIKEAIKIIKRYFSSFDAINKIHVAGIRCPVCMDHHLIEACWNDHGVCLNSGAGIERFYCERCGIGFDTWSHNMLTPHTEEYSWPIMFNITLKQKASRADNTVAHIPLGELYFDGQNICFDVCIEYELINGIKLAKNIERSELLKKMTNDDGLLCLTAKFPVCKDDLLLAKKSFCVLR